MSVKSLKLIIVLLALALLAACFKIYSLNQAQNAQPPSNAPYTNSHAQVNGDTVSATDASKEARDSASIAVDSLPLEAQQVLKKIQNRESFPYRQDGQVFGNRERLLPNQPRGYYQEYTVPTLGADNRGARRIVAGQGKTGDVASSGEYYYTADHYRSFSRIRME
ncbi:MAG: rnaSA [Burkholderiaceae bacterium]|nr:rnaSA [Burkholderiaceae bacterium]